MEKVINVINNIWFRRGVSVLSIGYIFFLSWVAWIAVAYKQTATNGTSLFALYLLINLAFGGIMFFTRKQIATQIVATLAPIVPVAILVFAFGQWFMIVPPLVVCGIVFFASGASETLKTVLGTIYFIMIVLAIIGYLTLEMFLGNISFTTVNLDERSDDYLYSEDKKYRIVYYLDDESKERRTISYYIEKADEDMHLWFLDCEKVLGCKRVLTTLYVEGENHIKWKDNKTLIVDGKEQEVDFSEPVETSTTENTSTSPTSITKAKTTTTEDTDKTDKTTAA